MQATARDILAIPELPESARGCHKFKDIHLPLISVPKLCRAGCKVQFSKTKVDVTSQSRQHLITGILDPMRNLYMFPIPDCTPVPAAMPGPQAHTAHNAYAIKSTRTLLQYLHATANFSPLSTFKDAINKGAYTTWPGLTVDRDDTFLQEVPQTTMGHMHKLRQGIRLTQVPKTDPNT
eukprot:CAMPEP_0168189478 /NCGR_PEP_ID=MMETSP0139_2-20121125/16376_1 /TAXON_ID=44445 /ORGANISM="Pseudo-nitzschia australis, Strain 10249 10 AB" /LENGTH=177 /DNA_ID=CAMNT_0008112333 /DNA_START=527 /DNA_END=1056 /DNA_ORIENTATION=-